MIDRVDLLALGVLAQCIATITLSIVLVVMYWRSSKLRHVLPLVIAHNMLAVLASYRIAMRLVTDGYVVWTVLVAFALGLVGLIIVLSQKWPRRVGGVDEG